MSWVEIISPGPLTTPQDLGRPGLAGLGVSPSGACDRWSLRLANRIVGNDEGAAALEVTAGGLALRSHGDHVMAITGAPVSIDVGGRPAAMGAPTSVGSGAVLRLGRPDRGLRTYLAVRGGMVLPRTLGSSSTDVLAGLGPAPARAGDRISIGRASGRWSAVDVAPVITRLEDPLELEVRLGPRDDWFTDTARTLLVTSTYRASAHLNRIGLRLQGPALTRSSPDELPSEPVVRGALQVPPSGQPTLMLADHPVTGGYPVIAVVTRRDLDAAAQVRPGQGVLFRVARRVPGGYRSAGLR